MDSLWSPKIMMWYVEQTYNASIAEVKKGISVGKRHQPEDGASPTPPAPVPASPGGACRRTPPGGPANPCTYGKIFPTLKGKSNWNQSLPLTQHWLPWSPYTGCLTHPKASGGADEQNGKGRSGAASEYLYESQQTKYLVNIFTRHTNSIFSRYQCPLHWAAYHPTQWTRQMWHRSTWPSMTTKTKASCWRGSTWPPTSLSALPPPNARSVNVMTFFPYPWWSISPGHCGRQILLLCCCWCF